MNLRTYLNDMPVAKQIVFAKRCGTSIGYLRKWLCVQGELGAAIAIAIERESGGKVRVESLSPRPDWAYLRGTRSTQKAAA